MMQWDKQKTVFSTILLLLLSVSWWLSSIFSTEKINFDGDKRHDPDYFIKQLIATQTNEKGLKTYVLKAALYEHFPDDGTARLVKPYVIKYRDNQDPIYISADIGWLSRDGKQLRLTGNVKQRQDNNVVTTNRMNLWLE